MIEYNVMVDKIRQRFNECYETVKPRHNLPKIPIKFNLKGTCGGQFQIENQECCFRINAGLAMRNIEEYLKQIIPHEFCHYMNRKSTQRSHGRNWQYYMINYFGLMPDRCHKMDTSETRQRRKRFTYICECNEFELGPIRHRKIQLENATYRCRTCRSPLKLKQ